ncbi:cytochrome C oxidase subunit IV family protein, partial [Xanthovirga aplysinae]|uniref:cytochrome C oxidase subunit IV family protein n=1 Tax=Xanthovirga aplysinae TaxID=2529853 RepID=UPI0012BB7EC1
MELEETTKVIAEPVDRSKIMKLVRVAVILAVVTAIEFLLAFTVPRGMTLNILFVVLTIVKAYFIVAEFMHLGHEVKTLIWAIVLPMLFVCWLILALMIESAYIFDARYLI